MNSAFAKKRQSTDKKRQLSSEYIRLLRVMKSRTKLTSEKKSTECVAHSTHEFYNC